MKPALIVLAAIALLNVSAGFSTPSDDFSHPDLRDPNVNRPSGDDGVNNKIQFDMKLLEELLAGRRFEVPGGGEEGSNFFAADSGLADEETGCFADLGAIMKSFSDFSEALVDRSVVKIMISGWALAKSVFKGLKCFTLSAANYLVDYFRLR